jgi:hypothetical protein
MGLLTSTTLGKGIGQDQAEFEVHVPIACEAVKDRKCPTRIPKCSVEPGEVLAGNPIAWGDRDSFARSLDGLVEVAHCRTGKAKIDQEAGP